MREKISEGRFSLLFLITITEHDNKLNNYLSIDKLKITNNINNLFFDSLIDRSIVKMMKQ